MRLIIRLASFLLFAVLLVGCGGPAATTSSEPLKDPDNPNPPAPKTKGRMPAQ